MIEFANIRPGSKVLDIATGIGEPSISVAKLVGDSGRVLAIDISSQMLSIAKRRAISLGLNHVIEFKEADANSIKFPNSAFDSVLCRWGMTLFLDLAEGLSKIYKSLIGGGSFAAAVWASQEKVPVLVLPINTIMKKINSELSSPELPGPFSLSDENLLKSSLLGSGFKEVNIKRVNVTFEFKSPEVYTRFIQDTAPFQALLSDVSQERREELWNSLTEAARRYTVNGSVELNNEAICVVGKK